MSAHGKKTQDMTKRPLNRVYSVTKYLKKEMDFVVEDVKSTLAKVSDLAIKHTHCYACREPVGEVVIASDTPIGQKAFCSLECWSLWCEVNCPINIDMREIAMKRKAQVAKDYDEATVEPEKKEKGATVPPITTTDATA